MSSRPRPICSGSPTPRTAFVLSGGASLGALQVGMLRALYESGVVPDLLVGTSAGALNAAFVASRPQIPATADELARVWRGLTRRDVFPVSVRTLVGGMGRRGDHVVPDRGLRTIVKRHLNLEQIEDARVPLHVVAFDLVSGEEVCLSRGPALAAILGASAVPGVLPPVPHGDLLLVDGGVVNNTPISHAVELGAERIYVLPTQGDDRRAPTGPRSALDAAVHALTLLVGARQEVDMAHHRPEVELIVLPAANPGRVQPIDFDQASRLIVDGRTAARAALAAAVPSPAVAA